MNIIKLKIKDKGCKRENYYSGYRLYWIIQCNSISATQLSHYVINYSRKGRYDQSENISNY